jgi:5-formyltetrahydrofolate cyclo-ligase
MTQDDAKRAARKEGFARRKEAQAAGGDAAAQAYLMAFLAPHAGRTLAGYLPIRSEIDPVPVMAAWTGPVGVPVIDGPGLPLRFRHWSPSGPMTHGPFGILVPDADEELAPEVLIVPLVAFDGTGGRLGYGGGFYDRTLARLRGQGPVVAVGFAYAAQEAATLPRDATDQKLDAVVTETGVRLFGH